MTAAAPSGVVTFLFTDVEGSARRSLNGNARFLLSRRSARYRVTKVITSRLVQNSYDLHHTVRHCIWSGDNTAAIGGSG